MGVIQINVTLTRKTGVGSNAVILRAGCWVVVLTPRSATAVVDTCRSRAGREVVVAVLTMWVINLKVVNASSLESYGIVGKHVVVINVGRFE